MSGEFFLNDYVAPSSHVWHTIVKPVILICLRFPHIILTNVFKKHKLNNVY